MKTTKRLIAFLSAVLLALGSVTVTTVITVFAEEPAAPELEVLVDESFDDYAPGHDGKATLLKDHFIVDANQIGEGCVQVEEDASNGNLFLFSHVFTQVYSTTSLANGYTFSLDVFSTQGAQNCAVFARAPLIEGFPYYETDGYAGGQSACVGGLVFNFQINSFSVNVKSFDASATANYGVKENMYTFNLPDGVIFNDGKVYTNFKIVDEVGEIQLYVEDALVGRIVLSGEKKGYAGDYFTAATGTYYETAVVYDAAGNELGTVQDTLVQANDAVVGWATRVANMIVDNVYLAAPKSDETVPETEAPTAEATSPAPDTDADTEAPTHAASEDVTDHATNAATDGETDPAGGCQSAVAVGGIALVLAAACLVLNKRK